MMRQFVPQRGDPESGRTSDQGKFYTVYRGRQSALHHLAYMRTGKIKAAKWLLQRNRIALAGISVFDFGFGAGTFFRHCDPDCKIAGIELDPENVSAVRDMLRRRGHEVSEVTVSPIKGWREHPLLGPHSKYDLLVLSHVLEHMDDPEATLARLSENLTPGTGRVLGLVPLNERKIDPDHKWKCGHEVVRDWAVASGYRIADYLELDHWMYWILPIAQSSTFLGRVSWQGISVILGLAQALFTPRQWFAMGRLAGRLTRAKPAQAAFLLAPLSDSGETSR